MDIPPHANQEDLEHLLSSEIRHSLHQMALTGVLLSPFCYMRCLLNPLWVLGLRTQGIFVTAIFGCYVGWLYVDGKAEAGETALLWWAVWAATMLIIHYFLYSLTALRLYRLSKKEQQPGSPVQGTTEPRQLSLAWSKSAEGYWQAGLVLQANRPGIYALRWELNDGATDITSPVGCTPPALSHLSRQAPTTTLTELYRLATGAHSLGLQLSNRDIPPPSNCMLTQLNDRS